MFKASSGGVCEQFTASMKVALKGDNDDEEADVDLGTWELMHLGNVVVESSSGDPVVLGALEQLQKDPELQQNDLCMLNVTNRNVTTTEKGSRQGIDRAFIKTITFIAVIPAPKARRKEKVFGYISKNIALDVRRCFLYKCSEKVSIEIGTAISKAFKLHRELPNPFAAPENQTLVPPPKSLSKAEIRRHFLYSTGVVGSGQFGEVHLAHLDMRGLGGQKGERTAVAVKMLKMSAPAENRDEFVRECEAMLQLKHPNLCELKGVSVRRRPWLCIIEVMKYGDIHSLVKKCKQKSFELNLAEQLHIAIQTCRGMAHMGNNGWVHMDLAARNILLSTDLVCKVADFGLSRRVDASGVYEQTESMKLPMKWMALESLTSRIFSEKTDVRNELTSIYVNSRTWMGCTMTRGRGNSVLPRRRTLLYRFFADVRNSCNSHTLLRSGRRV